MALSQYFGRRFVSVGRQLSTVSVNNRRDLGASKNTQRFGFFKLPVMPTVLRFDAYRVAIYTNVIAPHMFMSPDRKGEPFSS